MTFGEARDLGQAAGWVPDGTDEEIQVAKDFIESTGGDPNPEGEAGPLDQERGRLREQLGLPLLGETIEARASRKRQSMRDDEIAIQKKVRTAELAGKELGKRMVDFKFPTIGPDGMETEYRGRLGMEKAVEARLEYVEMPEWMETSLRQGVGFEL